MDGKPKLAIRLEGIRKRFPGAACDLFAGFSLAIERGESVAIVGASGCGKTTLLNIVALLEETDEGSIFLDGSPRSVDDAGRVPLGYIFQEDALLPWSTVLDNVLLGARCRGEPITSALLSRALGLMERLGIGSLGLRRPESISGGQRQRVALAQNLLLEPSLLLLDEPFASLDYQTKLILEEELLRVMRSSAADGQPRTTVLVTHDIEEALVLADRVLVLGRREGAPAEVALDLPVALSDSQRDPVQARQHPAVQEAFAQVWSTIKPYALSAGG
jgi:NitT/TauT family transport system ATP-binding protein